MSEEEKKAIEDIKYKNKGLWCGKTDVDFLLNLIEKQSKEIEKLNKIINLMAGDIWIECVKENGRHFDTEEEVIEFYMKKEMER